MTSTSHSVDSRDNAPFVDRWDISSIARPRQVVKKPRRSPDQSSGTASAPALTTTLEMSAVESRRESESATPDSAATTAALPPKPSSSSAVPRTRTPVIEPKAVAKNSGALPPPSSRHILNAFVEARGFYIDASSYVYQLVGEGKLVLAGRHVPGSSKLAELKADELATLAKQFVISYVHNYDDFISSKQ